MKVWETTEVKSTDLEDELNKLEAKGKTIFEVLRTQGGFTENFMIVYYQ